MKDSLMFIIQIGASDGKIDTHRVVDEVYTGVTEKGWNAVLVEPNPRHYEELIRTYRGINTVILVKYAISDHNGSTDFYDCQMQGASTLIESVLERNDYHDGKSKDYKKIVVDCMTISMLLDKYGVPDYLVIDAEGYDGTILEMLDLDKYQIPKIRFEFAHLEHGEVQQAQLGRVCLKLIKDGYVLSHDMADIIAEKI